MQMRTRAGILLTVAATMSAMASPSIAAAQTAGLRSVLTIHVGAENYPSNPLLEAGIREALRSRPDLPIDYFAEYLESELFPLEELSDVFEDYIRRKYQNRRLDLVITTTDVGLRFALAHRAALFPHAPIVFASTAVPEDLNRREGAGLAGIKVGLAYTETLKQALALHPSTEHVFVVTTGSSGPIVESIRAAFREFWSGVTLTFIDEPTVPRLLAAIKRVPSQSLILYQAHIQQEPGRRMDTNEVAPLVVRAASVPVYGTADIYMGTGVVGGLVRDTRETGVRLGEIAMRILTGTRAQDISIESPPMVPMFDWRAMKQWGIAESRLPAGSIVLFRGPSLWRDFRNEVLVVLGGLIVQSILILGLLYQRRARYRAEVESRRNLALAADANRRVTMSALTGSIAHELSQPLNSIMHNAQAGEMLVASNLATPNTLREILSDIRTADVRATQIIERHRTMLKNHQLVKKPLDIHAVVRESLALVAHDAEARHIQIDADLPSEPCVVAGDQVLLQQVLVNLVMNAMEAMAETLPDRRRVRVQNEVKADNVEVSVRDDGTGLPKVDGHVFEPFVTTKTNGIGIGLTIAGTIVEAHGGRMEAHNNPDGGATFTVTLPRNGTS